MNSARPKPFILSAGQPLPPVRNVTRGVIAVAIGGLAVLTLVLLARCSAMVRPLPTTTLLMVSGSLAVGVMGITSLWKHAWPRVAGTADRHWQLAVLLITIGLLLLMAGTLTTTELSQSALAALWLPVVMAVAILSPLAWRVFQSHATPHASRQPPTDNERVTQPTSTFEPAAVAGGQTTQQLSRGRALDGSDWLQGRLLVELLPGQRTATVHVAFCPPFAALPGLQASAESASDAKVKVVQVLPHGARLELKLTAAASRRTTEWLVFTATDGVPVSTTSAAVSLQ